MKEISGKDHIWKILRVIVTPEELIKGIQQLYKKTINSLKTKQEKSKPFEITVGVKQESILSPILFTVVLGEATKTAKEEIKTYGIG